jgi:hypothetical protein
MPSLVNVYGSPDASGEGARPLLFDEVLCEPGAPWKDDDALEIIVVYHVAAELAGVVGDWFCPVCGTFTGDDATTVIQ